MNKYKNNQKNGAMADYSRDLGTKVDYRAEARDELKAQIYSSLDYALNEAGFKFAKTIYEIDPDLAREIISVVYKAVITGDFEKAKSDYEKMIESKMNPTKTEGKRK